MAETDFFGGAKGLREISPQIEQEAIQLSNEQGFNLRQPMRDPPKRNRGTSKQLHNMTMRLHMDDIEQFIRYCENERIAYREGFQRLVSVVAKENEGGR